MSVVCSGSMSKALVLPAVIETGLFRVDVEWIDVA